MTFIIRLTLRHHGLQTRHAREPCAVTAPSVSVERGAPLSVGTGGGRIRTQTLPRVGVKVVRMLLCCEFPPPDTDSLQCVPVSQCVFSAGPPWFVRRHRHTLRAGREDCELVTSDSAR